MKRTLLHALLPITAFLLMTHSIALAHVVCGDRVFPTTLTMDDPGVSDELSLPTIAFTPTPSGESNTYAYEWDKTITEDLGVGINGNYIAQFSPTTTLHGWNNISVTLKDHHPCPSSVATHNELAWSIGVVRLLPGTGSAQLRDAGAIPDFGSTAPTFYIGKGFGALRDGNLRPFAMTGEVSRVISNNPSVSPNAWTYAASLQYSMPYMQQHVKALNVPNWMTHTTPIVEYAMTTPDGGTPTGTISPGLLYDANNWQLGAEAVIPANHTTHLGQGTGFVIQFHVFLDTYYQSWFGRPIIEKDLWGNE
jgi:hypothetical protein